MYFGPGAHPKKSRKVDEGSGTGVFWGAAEGMGIVMVGEQEAQERSCHSLQIPERH